VSGNGVMGTRGAASGVVARVGSTTANNAGVLGDTDLNDSAGVIGLGRAGVSNCGVMGVKAGPSGRYVPAGVVGDANAGGSVVNQATYGVAALNGVGVGLYVDGAQAAMVFAPNDNPGPPTAGQHNKGEVMMDSLGTLWFCVQQGSPGAWARFAHVAQKFGSQANAGGVVNFLPNPIRLKDTRLGVDHTRLGGGSAFDLQVTGVDVGGVSVPTGAVGVLGTLTVTDTDAPGYLTVYPAGSPTVTSNINWSGPNQTLATSFVCGLDANGRLTVHNGIENPNSGNTHVVVDVAAFVF
jgi:hypothetical protein